jgi:hypothetical protein
VEGWSGPPVSLAVHRGKAVGWFTMDKCKVRIRRLTLTHEAIINAKVHEEQGGDVEEASRILDRERHQCAKEVSVASSSIWHPEKSLNVS